MARVPSEPKTRMSSPISIQAFLIPHQTWSKYRAIPIASKQLSCLAYSFPAMSLSRRGALRVLSVHALSLLAKPALANSPYFDKYDKYASNYEFLDGRSFFTKLFGFDALRTKMLEKAFGDVLEVGIGTGVNLPLYDPNRVSSITGLDFSNEMLSEARKKLMNGMERNISVKLVQGLAEKIDLREGSYDCVIDTFSLCVFPHPDKALLEMRRMLKQSVDSRVFLLEHSLSPNTAIASYQNLTAEPTAAMSKGCYPNQNVHEMVLNAGFKLVEQKYSLGGSVICLELALNT